ncbi:SGNH/GDSL hydrolase family protein [Luteococcus peritonei]|uniref:SGNH/GDSL hydrolase family protein n=1 Tax=Luteococcus peritonei TaxID=88874 RepID=A0ABW4RT10_9ACTN
MKTWQRYVAIGDSFSEGMCDPDPSRENSYLGWTDRLAHLLAADAREAGHDLAYANLAIRGRLLDDILGRQLPLALELKPDLVSLVGGGNDVLRPGSDVDALSQRMEQAVVQLRSAGIDVLMATPTDPKEAPLLRATRSRCAIYLANLHTIARRHGCALVDQWGLDEIKDWRMWAEDRLHMTPEGHVRVALAAYEALGGDPSDRPEALPPAAPVGRAQWLRENAQWAREYVRPWVHRRLTGRSSGDGLSAKRPELVVVDPDEQLPTPRF